MTRIAFFLSLHQSFFSNHSSYLTRHTIFFVSQLSLSHNYNNTDTGVKLGQRRRQISVSQVTLNQAKTPLFRKMGPFQLFPVATILVSLHFLIIFYVSNIPLAFAQNENQFIYNGFRPAKLHLDGSAQLLSNGLLQLTNIKNISSPQVGHVFYQFPLKFNTTSTGSTLSLSFSTNFVFAIVPEVPSSGGGHGMTFTISPSWNFIHAGGNQYLGLFNSSNDGLPVNHILAIELDTILNPEFGDIDRNHVGIDVNSLNSTELAPAMYFSNKEGKNISLELTSGNPMHLWIDYDEAEELLNVTLAPTRIPKPNWPLMSKHIDLSQYLLESMYVGFSATTGTRAQVTTIFLDGALIKVDKHKALMFRSFLHFLDKGKQKRYPD